MNILLAAGISTTTDDRGYLMWLAQNWAIFVPPALAFTAFLFAWVIRQVHRWTTGASPGSPSQTSARLENRDLPERQNPASEHTSGCDERMQIGGPGEWPAFAFVGVG
jgi:hypothetical protein